MPSKRFLCCTCAESSDADEENKYGYELANSYRRQKARPKGKSGKKTWTRKSLLENEVNNQDMIPLQFLPYQMRSLETPNSVPMTLHDDDNEIRKRLQAQITSRKRTSTNEEFQRQTSDASTSKTTFPWMDEGFVPSSRTGTRLGVSSVQMNAKRNGLANRNLELLDQESASVPKHAKSSAFHPYTKSLSFAEGDQQFYATWCDNKLVPQGKTVSNGYNLRLGSNENTSRFNPGFPHDERPKVFRAPKSDVGISRITSNNRHIRPPDVIPRLENVHGITLKPSEMAGSNNIQNVQTTKVRKSVKEIFPSTIDFSDESADELTSNADSSYASNVTFRSQHSNANSSDVSLKRTSHPGMFSAVGKYEILKSHSTISKNMSKKAINRKVESLYGYVPRAVTNVYASNALEGSQIDDFFRQRRNELLETNVDTSAYNNHENDSKSTNEDTQNEPVIITTVLEEDGESSRNQTEVDAAKQRHICWSQKTNECVSGESIRPLSQNNVAEIGIDQMFHKLNIQKVSTQESEKRNMFTDLPFDSKDTKRPSPNGRNNISGQRKLTSQKHKQGSEAEVIMIDFPPNVEANRKSSFNKDSNTVCNTSHPGSEISMRSTSSTTALLGHSEVLY
ncbi:uncharacterized protein LOC128242203 [Mya arenaria]|uniref:uncharacterized protein LOC128242203 n=1 Tax=Mya arenaria TaxID=6604 RepID=UPI0022E22053|nr:uncharacterized protein LOC128242203 [Mya arenaria]XP_052815241.1 uncharacterized protein LOC128242203 [Mya arenaria]